MKVLLTKSATADIDEAIEFYENQDPGAGKYFLDSIREDILRLRESAGIHRKALGKYHRMICTHHPYAVFYDIADGTATIKAVLDCRRAPWWLKKKLRRR
jgi:plasmid stabilization system protein ParE